MSRLSQLTVMGKLTLLVGVFLIGFTAIGAITFAALSRVRINGPMYREITRSKEVLADVVSPSLYIVESDRLMQESLEAGDLVELRAIMDRSTKLREEYEARHRHWEAELTDGELRTQLLETSFAPAERFFKLRDEQMFPAILAGDLSRARELATSSLEPLYEEHRKAIDSVVATATSSASELEGRANQAVTWTLYELVAASLLIALISAAAAWLIARSLVSRLQHASVVLSSTATQMSASSREQQSRVGEQSASTSEIAATVKEISATSRDLVKTAEELSLGAARAAGLALEGRGGLERMDARMRALSTSTGSISVKLSAIREKTNDINVVVTTITKVADQTNLLSVNAAIEAEKAGEYGLGFLVVAREIRRLADQAAVATLDIEDMVRQMQGAVSTGVMEMDKFDDEVRTSVKAVQEVSEQLGGVIEEVEGFHGRFDALKEGMRSQSLGAEQINDAMVSLADGAQQTAASLREFNAATDGLRDVVANLRT
ncbi:MAG TPA: methyl-accepting chemotaxis protein [Myxococcota bacterium]|nr:methyl-accepting chemotaxis protein [Myxococcota bacterium]